MATSGRINRSGVKAVRHAHFLSRGLLICGRCRTAMQGRSGTGREGAVRFYYACPNKECGFRFASHEIERAIIDRVHALGDSSETID